jgi:hypothetical protein
MASGVLGILAHPSHITATLKLFFRYHWNFPTCSLLNPTKISKLPPRAMGTGKKEAQRKIRQGKIGDGMANVKVKGENFYRSAKKAKRLKIENGGTAQHNAAGKVTKAAAFQSREVPQGRIEVSLFPMALNEKIHAHFTTSQIENGLRILELSLRML